MKKYTNKILILLLAVFAHSVDGVKIVPNGIYTSSSNTDDAGWSGIHDIELKNAT